VRTSAFTRSLSGRDQDRGDWNVSSSLVDAESTITITLSRMRKICRRRRVTRPPADKNSFGNPGNGMQFSWRRGADPPKNESMPRLFPITNLKYPRAGLGIRNRYARTGLPPSQRNRRFRRRGDRRTRLLHFRHTCTSVCHSSSSPMVTRPISH
jgi:hypothetical protein